MAKTLEFRGIGKSYPGVRALDNVNFKVESGKVLASYTPEKSYQSIVISTEGLEVGGTYTVTAGSFSQTVTLTSTIYGNGMGSFGGMGGFRGMGGRPGDMQGETSGFGGQSGMGGFGGRR